MPRQTFVNLAVKDVARSKAFFERIGFAFEPRFSTENAACMIVDASTFVMFLAEPFFRTFTKKEVCDAKSSTEVLMSLSCDSRSEVDRLVDAAVHAGAESEREAEERGFMYARAFEDPDGHVWELMFMDTTVEVSPGS
jgi:predicted lactoylglutathione lyase